MLVKVNYSRREDLVSDDYPALRAISRIVDRGPLFDDNRSITLRTKVDPQSIACRADQKEDRQEMNHDSVNQQLGNYVTRTVKAGISCRL